MSSNTERSEPGLSGEFQENLNILRQIPVFSPLPLDSLKVFAYLCDRETYRPDDDLFRKNEDDGQAFYFISGTARLIHEGTDGTQSLAEFGAGDFIGGLTLLGKSPRLFSMRAVTDTTCLVMNRNKFAKAVEQFPDLMPRILQALVGRIVQWEKQFLAAHAGGCEDCLKRAGVSLL